MSKLVLIDGNAILHRAYHALPKTLSTKSGEPINAVYGFVSMLLRIIQDLEPTHIAACFDRKEPTFRQKVFKEYQAQRPEMDKELSGQFEKTKQVIESFGIPIYEKAGFEADDLLGTLAVQAIGHQTSDISNKKKSEDRRPKSIDQVIIVTGDRDILQLVNEKVKVYLPIKGLSESKLFGSREVVEKMGIKPELIPDYKALVGDPSDNYPGVAGIGPKTTISLLSKFKSKDGIYKNLSKVDSSTREKLEKYRDNAEMSYKLAKIVTDVDITPDWEDMDDWGVGRQETLDVFADFGFKTLTKRVKDFGKDSSHEILYRKNLTSVNVKKIVRKLARKLSGKRYAIRGTASLFLQSIEMKVDDVDLICDEKTALLCNKIFVKYLVSKVRFRESDKFKSFFGEFNFGGVKVEVMGVWRIKNDKGDWSKPYDAREEQVTRLEIDGDEVIVTSVETELSMFSQMGRWNAYHRIKKQLEKKNQQSLF